MQPEDEELIPIEPAQMSYPVPDVPVSKRKPFWGYLDLALVLGLLCAFVAVIMLVAAVFVLAIPSLRQDQGPALDESG